MSNYLSLDFLDSVVVEVCLYLGVYGSEHVKHNDKIHRLCYDLEDFYTSRQRRGKIQLCMTQYLGISSMDQDFQKHFFDTT